MGRHNYPISLDIGQRRVVIVGGGRVAAHKARGLLDAGATFPTNGGRVMLRQFNAPRIFRG
ncbi:MAG: NAD(P)-dependent oxidoreductase [Phycisphaerales bacterium]|nr:NAD(P)-dependent oxidoreductase [Phycisphaerales bacterium]